MCVSNEQNEESIHKLVLQLGAESILLLSRLQEGGWHSGLLGFTYVVVTRVPADCILSE
jgi:hypothetical protein